MRKEQQSYYFAEVETEGNYKGYIFSVGEVITISILGTFCGLRNMQQIHQWANSSKIRTFLAEEFGIKNMMCYSWFTQVIGMIKPESVKLSSPPHLLLHLLRATLKPPQLVHVIKPRSIKHLSGFKRFNIL